MNVNFDFNFWTVLMFVLNFGVVMWVQVSNRGKAATDELKAVHHSLSGETKALEDKVFQRLGQHSERLKAVETLMDNGIDTDDITAAHRRVDGLLEKVARVDGKMEQLTRRVDEVLDDIRQTRAWLMQHCGGKP